MSFYAPQSEGMVCERGMNRSGDTYGTGTDQFMDEESHSSIGDESVSTAEDAALGWIPGEDEEGEEHVNGFDEEMEMRGYMVSTFTRALASDMENQQRQVTGASETAKETTQVEKGKICCVCGDDSVYTCPGCGARTCSIICVRVHKERFACTGERDIAKKVPLGEFTDRQLQRDFHFLEDVRRVISNCERTFPKLWRYTFRALPPPLHALREAAKKRGVVCQITSEGMKKRDENTSRYDRRTETITWHCQFNFHHPNFTVSTDWGSERHRLGDIVTYCWAFKPPLPCFHINRQYNRASKWIEAMEEGEGDEGHQQEEEQEKLEHEQEEQQVQVEQQQEGEWGFSREMDVGIAVGGDSSVCMPLFVENHPHHPQQMWSPCQLSIPASSPTDPNKEAVAAFLGTEPVAILAHAERMGLQQKYFRLSPSSTLNEALRTLFFISEFPVFEIVHASELPAYPLVTEADKEAIRESFRMTPRPPRPAMKPRRTKADLGPEDAERYARIPCRLFLAGCCRLTEDQCPYWHCAYRDVPACRSFVKFASCEKGDRCSFRHDDAAVTVARKRAREERQQLHGRGRFRGENRGRP